MIDITDKNIVSREAMATGTITLEIISSDEIFPVALIRGSWIESG